MAVLYDPNNTTQNAVSSITDELTGLTKTEKKMDIFRFMKAMTNLGDARTVLTDTLHGFNTNLNGDSGKAGLLSDPTLVSKVFITRPMLNLSTSQLIQNRKLAKLLVNDENNINSFVRMTLDPRLGAIGDELDEKKKLTSALLDNKNAFIPLLTNTFVSMSGWANTTTQVSYSKAGVAAEESFMIDGGGHNFGKVELDLTFRRIKHDPILQLMNIWTIVPILQYKGIIQPYYDFIRADEYNYNCRIYRLMLSSDGKYVKYIATTGASAPMSIDDGSIFNASDKDSPYAESDNTATYRFAGTGARYNDPISILEFNQVVGIFHPGMKMLDEGQLGHGMVIIPDQFKHLANGMGYPRISLETMELQWYLETDTLDALIKNMEDLQ